MPPHCDSLDGPVVKAARLALEQADVRLVLPYVPQPSETEVIAAFDRVLPLCRDGQGARAVAEQFFFETVVRLHRAGEGAPFTGLKPAGLDVGPVIPLAEHAIETGQPEALLSALRDIVKAQALRRFEHMQHLRTHAAEGGEAARAYVEAMLGLQVWAHQVYLAASDEPHAGGEAHHH
jgi:hypothetical protein